MLEKLKENALDCLLETGVNKDEAMDEGIDEAVISMTTLGRIGDSGKAPPILVALKSSLVARLVVRHASRLRTVSGLSRIYITPDMSQEDREKRKELVDQLKKKIAQFHEQHWVIRQGSVTSTGKFIPRKRERSASDEKAEASFNY